VKLALPLVRFSDPDPQQVATWRERWAALPRPWIALLLGGPSPQLAFTEANLEALASGTNALSAAGTRFLTASRRTPAEALARVARCLRDPKWIDEPTRRVHGNPYPALLSLADELVVTGDSASMLAEACASGKPVHIYGSAERPAGLRRRLRHRFGAYMEKRQAAGAAAAGWLERVQDALHDAKLLRYPRDLHLLHKALYRAGLAMPLGAAQPAFPGDAAGARVRWQAEIDRAAARVRELLNDERTG
jgi:hypothetical protein